MERQVRDRIQTRLKLQGHIGIQRQDRTITCTEVAAGALLRWNVSFPRLGDVCRYAIIGAVPYREANVTDQRPTKPVQEVQPVDVAGTPYLRSEQWRIQFSITDETTDPKKKVHAALTESGCHYCGLSTTEDGVGLYYAKCEPSFMVARYPAQGQNIDLKVLAVKDADTVQSWIENLLTITNKDRGLACTVQHSVNPDTEV